MLESHTLCCVSLAGSPPTCSKLWDACLKAPGVLHRSSREAMLSLMPWIAALSDGYLSHPWKVGPRPLFNIHLLMENTFQLYMHKMLSVQRMRLPCLIVSNWITILLLWLPPLRAELVWTVGKCSRVMLSYCDVLLLKAEHNSWLRTFSWAKAFIILSAEYWRRCVVNYLGLQ